MIAEPTSMSVFWTRRRDAVRDELVERLDVVRQAADDHAGAVPLVEAEREALQVAEELVAEVGEDPLARPAGEVRLRGRRARVREAGDEEERDDPARARRGRPRAMPSSIASFARYGGSERGRRRERAAKTIASAVRRLVRRRQAGERARSAARSRATTSRRPSPPRSRIRWLPGWQTLMRSPPRRSTRTPLEQPVLVDLPVDRARLEQLVVRAARRDPAAVEHDDLVGERDRREPVRDDDRRPAAHRLAQPEPDLRLGRRVDRRRGVVEDEDARVDDERARDRDPLALPAGERDPALADHRVVAVREPLDELVRLREPRRRLDLLVGRVDAAERDVLAHGRREEERILRDDADRPPERARASRRARRRRRARRARSVTS